MRLKNCPCGKNKPYTECCQIVHQNIHLAQTAEDLMRARYTAFTKGLGNFLFDSHSVKTRVEKDKKHIENWAKSVTWLHLDVLHTTNGKKEDSHGTVEFKAFFVDHGKVDVIHENSLFCKEDGKWVYDVAL